MLDSVQAGNTCCEYPHSQELLLPCKQTASCIYSYDKLVQGGQQICPANQLLMHSACILTMACNPIKQGNCTSKPFQYIQVCISADNAHEQAHSGKKAIANAAGRGTETSVELEAGRDCCMAPAAAVMTNIP